jgi:hypothetical protein
MRLGLGQQSYSHYVKPWTLIPRRLEPGLYRPCLSARGHKTMPPTTLETSLHGVAHNTNDGSPSIHANCTAPTPIPEPCLLSLPS